MWNILKATGITVLIMSVALAVIFVTPIIIALIVLVITGFISYLCVMNPDIDQKMKDLKKKKSKD